MVAKSLYGPIEREWFDHPEWWFDAKKRYDSLLSDEYGYLLHFDVKNFDYFDNVKLLSYILIHDQISRHVARATNNTNKWVRSHTLSASTASDKICEIGFKGLTPEQRIFALMPYRHLKNKDKIKFSIDLVRKWKRKDPRNIFYSRFYEASLKCYSELVDDDIEIASEKPKTFFEKVVNKISVFALDVHNCSFFSLIKAFVFNSYDNCEFLSSTFYNGIERNIGSFGKHAIVSLSGGVDSITLLNIGVRMLKSKKLDSLSAVHINYGNTFRSKFERAFILNCCNHFGVPLLIRDIDEFHRKDVGRYFYEAETQKIRFRMYSRMIQLLDLPSYTPVFLGHNQDDCLENIFTNISRKVHYDNLGGMDYISFKHGIKIVRPLLFSSKKNILDEARKAGMLHTLNSTPSTCSRGKLRLKLIPHIENSDPHLLHGLLELSEYNKSMKRLIDSQMKIWRSKIKIMDDEDFLAKMPHDPLIPLSMYKDFLVELCHDKCIKIPSHKAIESCFHYANVKPKMKLSLSKDLFLERHDENLFIKRACA